MRHYSPSHETAISQAGKPSQNLKMGFGDPSTYTQFLLKFTHQNSELKQLVNLLFFLLAVNLKTEISSKTWTLKTAMLSFRK